MAHMLITLFLYARILKMQPDRLHGMLPAAVTVRLWTKGRPVFLYSITTYREILLAPIKDSPEYQETQHSAILKWPSKLRGLFYAKLPKRCNGKLTIFYSSHVELARHDDIDVSWD